MNRNLVRGTALCAALLLPSTRAAVAQTTIFNSNGFEAGTFNTGNIHNQQGFQALPLTSAGSIQTATVFAGSRAFRINGPTTASNVPFGDVNFWYKPYTQANTVNPVNLGTPHVQLSGQFRMSGNGATAFADIPFAGFHFEGYYGGGANDTQMISSVYMASDGRFMVLTTDGLEMFSTQTFGREQWHNVVADFNFQAQTFRVFVNDQLLDFGGSPEVAFRNSFGQTQSIFEIGFEATWNSFTSAGGQNQFFIDDYHVTRSAVPYAPVPEPAACLAVAGLALAGYRRLRKRVTAAVPTP